MLETNLISIRVSNDLSVKAIMYDDIYHTLYQK